MADKRAILLLSKPLNWKNYSITRIIFPTSFTKKFPELLYGITVDKFILLIKNLYFDTTDEGINTFFESGVKLLLIPKTKYCKRKFKGEKSAIKIFKQLTWDTASAGVSVYLKHHQLVKHYRVYFIIKGYAFLPTDEKIKVKTTLRLSSASYKITFYTSDYKVSYNLLVKPSLLKINPNKEENK